MKCQPALSCFFPAAIRCLGLASPSKARKTSSQRGSGVCVAGGFATMVILLLPQAVFAVGPVILEESARVSSPEGAFPLNGALALDGDFLLAGSSVHGESSSRHAVFLFARRSATSWTLVSKLLETPTIPSAPLSVSISGGTGAISAGFITFIFERQSGVWRRTATLKMPPGASITSDTAVTSTLVAVGGTAEGRFVSYVYEKNSTGMWVMSARLNAGIAHPNRFFDVPQIDAVAKQGVQRLVIGSPDYDPNPPAGAPAVGDVFVYERAAARCVDTYGGREWSTETATQQRRGGRSRRYPRVRPCRARSHQRLGRCVF